MPIIAKITSQNARARESSGEICQLYRVLKHETDPTPYIASGECFGEILTEERGENGFGYDSLFFYPPKACTFAELETKEKKAISHRAIALEQLKQQLAGENK